MRLTWMGLTACVISLVIGLAAGVALSKTSTPEPALLKAEPMPALPKLFRKEQEQVTFVALYYCFNKTDCLDNLLTARILGETSQAAIFSLRTFLRSRTSADPAMQADLQALMKPTAELQEIFARMLKRTEERLAAGPPKPR